MRKGDKKEFTIIGVIIVLCIVLFAVSYNHQKTECISQGGKWISGVIGGNFSYFCIPK